MSDPKISRARRKEKMNNGIPEPTKATEVDPERVLQVALRRLAAAEHQAALYKALFLLSNAEEGMYVTSMADIGNAEELFETRIDELEGERILIYIEAKEQAVVGAIEDYLKENEDETHNNLDTSGGNTEGEASSDS